MGSGEREHGLRWPTELQKQRNQRNRKNSGNTDFAHSRELSERPEFHQAPCEPPKGNGKGSALKLLNKLASGPASLSTVAHQDLKPGAHGKNPRAMARSGKKHRMYVYSAGNQSTEGIINTRLILCYSIFPMRHVTFVSS